MYCINDNIKSYILTVTTIFIMGESEEIIYNGNTHTTKFIEKQPHEAMDKSEYVTRNDEKQSHKKIVWHNIFFFFWWPSFG